MKHSVIRTGKDDGPAFSVVNDERFGMEKGTQYPVPLLGGVSIVIIVVSVFAMHKVDEPIPDRALESQRGRE